jgi:2-oxoglutarate ferredoxin oxidoreductase subunit beta
MHAIRRNVDINYLLFNNEIYGLTKGQYSPTSRLGTRSPSTPTGSIDPPVSALQFAMGANARFIARTIDRRQDHMPVVLSRAAAHKGCSFVEIIQNCIVYNDGAFDSFAEKEVKDDQQLELQHGKPMIFGKAKNKGIHFNPKSMSLEVIEIGKDGKTLEDVVVHDEANRMLAVMLCQLEPPNFPVPIGVLYCNPAKAYEDAVWAQVAEAKKKLNGKQADLNAMLRKGATWTVAA